MAFNQKKIALINDVTGFGRCSIAVSLPIISALKVQCCFIPTAILSNHTGFNNFFFEDYTSKMTEYINNWEILGLNFDGLYSTYTDEMCKEMQNLIKYADVLTPNLTELCRLLDLAYPSQTPSHEELHMLCKKLSLQGPKKIVITGLQRQGLIENFIFESDKPYSVIKVEKIGIDRSGTGDVFSSIVSASIVKSESLYSSVEKATTFISKCLKFTTELGLPENQGVCFEEFLTELK